MSTDPSPATTPRARTADGRRSLMGQGGIVSGMTLVSRITGVARDVALSYFFGATAQADAFFVAFRIPNFFRRVFAEGAFAQAFIPVLAEYRARTTDELLRFVSLMVGNLATVVVLVSVFGSLGAEYLVRVFAIGFDPASEKFDLAVGLLRITFPYLALISLSAYAGAVLNSSGRFAVTAFAPVLLNLVLIAALLGGRGFFEVPVYALAWGVLAGGVLQLTFQLPSLGRMGMIRPPRLSLTDPGAVKVGKLIVPAMFAASVSQINTLVDTMLATTLATGSVSWLYYADRLMELPIGLVAVALGTVLLPNLSRLHAGGDTDGFGRAASWGMIVGMTLGVPAAVALYVLAVPLISTVFAYGAMLRFDVLMAAAALRAFAVGVVAMVLVKVLHPVFFARQDTRTPFRISACAVLVNVALNLALYRIMGHVGLAYATSVAATVNVYLLYRHLWVRGLFRPDREVGSTAIRVACAATVMGIGLWLASGDDGWWVAAGLAERVLRLGATAASGAAGYFLVLWLIGFRPGRLDHRA